MRGSTDTVEDGKGGRKHFTDFECNRMILKIPDHSNNLAKFMKCLQSGEIEDRLNYDSIRRNLDLQKIIGNQYRLPYNLPVINHLFPDLEIFSPERMIERDGILLLPGVHRILLRMEGDWVNERLARLAILHDTLSTKIGMLDNLVSDVVATKYGVKFPDSDSQTQVWDEVHWLFKDLRGCPEYVAIASLFKRWKNGEIRCKSLIECCARVARSPHVRTIAEEILQELDLGYHPRGAFLDYMALDLNGRLIRNRGFSRYICENQEPKGAFRDLIQYPD